MQLPLKLVECVLFSYSVTSLLSFIEKTPNLYKSSVAEFMETESVVTKFIWR